MVIKPERISIQTVEPTYRVEAEAVRIGKDVLVYIWGGERPHIGSIAAAQPRPSLAVCGGDKLDHGSGGFSFRGRRKTLPPVAFDPFGDGRWEDVHRGSLFTSSACLLC